MRHEIGHYYQPLLAPEGSEALERCRALMGDEREDYAQAMERHYAQGPPPDWPERFVSAYATMHPWEDWAETFAHYLHIRDVLQTATAYGLTVTGPPGAADSEPLYAYPAAATGDLPRAARRLAAAHLRAQRDQPQPGRRGPLPVRARPRRDREARARRPARPRRLTLRGRDVYVEAEGVDVVGRGGLWVVEPSFLLALVRGRVIGSEALAGSGAGGERGGRPGWSACARRCEARGGRCGAVGWVGWGLWEGLAGRRAGWGGWVVGWGWAGLLGGGDGRGGWWLGGGRSADQPKSW